MNYNDGQSHTDFYDKTLEEKEIIAKEFSEGSPTLEKCLLTMWSQGLLTAACCKGDHDPYDTVNSEYVDGFSYIAGMKGIDFFSYLSPKLINNEMVVLIFDENVQVIRFYGSEKDMLMLKFASDMLTGKKDNKKYLKKKIGKDITPICRENDFIYHMLKNGYSEKDINEMLPIARFMFNVEYHWFRYNTFSKNTIRKYYECAGELANMIYDAHNKTINNNNVLEQ